MAYMPTEEEAFRCRHRNRLIQTLTNGGERVMTPLELADRCQKLDRLYLAACAAREAYIAQPTEVNRRRWRYYASAYQRYVDAYTPSERGDQGG